MMNRTLFLIVSNAILLSRSCVAVPQCIPYSYLRETPDEVLICEKYGVIGADEMRWVDFEQYQSNAQLTTDFEVSDALHTELGTMDCFQHLYKNICLEHYPACVEVEGVAYPVMQCREPLCTNIFAECGTILAMMGSYGMDIVRQCDFVVDAEFATNLAAGTLTGGSKYPDYSMMIGQEWWPEVSSKIPLSNGGVQDVPCDPADGALVHECLVSEESCLAPFRLIPGQQVNGTQGCPSCEMACPFLLEPSTWESLWTAAVVPGILSILINSIAGYTYIPKTDKLTVTRQNRDGLMGFTVLLAWIYSIWDTLPALVLKFDIFCGGNSVLDPFSRGASRPVLCQVNRLAVHILQAFSFAVFLNMYNMFKLTSASKRMIQIKKLKLNVKTFTFVMFVPVVLAVCSYSSDKIDQPGFTGKQEPSVHMTYLRNSVRCGPRFTSMAMEAVIVHIPLLLASTASGMLATAILLQLKSASSRSGSTTTTTGAANTSKSVASNKKSSSSTQVDYVQVMKKVMTRYSIILVAFVVAYLVCAAQLVFEAETIGLGIKSWFTCLRTGETGRAISCPPDTPEWRCREFLPPMQRGECLEIFQIDPKLPSLLSAANVVPPLLPLLFGTLICHARITGLLKSRKALRKIGTQTMGTSIATSVAPSAAPSTVGPN